MPYRKFSTLLSLIVSFVVAAALVVLVFCGPRLFGFYITFRDPDVSREVLAELTKAISLVLYPCVALGFAAIYCLIRLLLNIMQDSAFLKINVSYLRIISWCCIGVAVITFAGAFFYLPFVFAAAAAGFVGLMLHVVKNVMQSAVEIKEDNDLTV